MKTALLCFTERGLETEQKLIHLFRAKGSETVSFAMGTHVAESGKLSPEDEIKVLPAGSLSDFAEIWFQEADALIFIGACGIAVRAIAPFVKDKKTDPAVLVIDEKAEYVIPILSGHIGGANELARLAAAALGAHPVITTATDRNRKFKVDVFAKKRHLTITDFTKAKWISADLVAGEPVGLFSDFPLGGPVPEELLCETMCRHNIWITISDKMTEGVRSQRVMKLIPRCVSVGIGCRRGTPEDKIYEILREVFEKNRIDLRSIGMISSIDIKKDEEGLQGITERFRIPFFTYSAEDLEKIPGTFTDSSFVRQTAGVGNVCERAAMASALSAAGNGRLLIRKVAKDGVTIAAAICSPVLFGPAGGSDS